MLKILTQGYNGLVIDVSDKAEVVENGILMNGLIYQNTDLTLTESNLEVIPIKHCFKGGVVSISPDYQITEGFIKEKAIDEYTMELVERGLL